MDWWLILGLVSFLIVVAIASFYLYVFVSRTKKEFRAAQPDLRVTNMATMSSGNVLTGPMDASSPAIGLLDGCVENPD